MHCLILYTDGISTCRLLLVLHCVAAVCEVGVVTVTLLHLMSGGNPEQQSTKRGEEVVTIAVSLVSTSFMSFMTVLGAGNAFSGMKVVAKGISAASHAVMGSAQFEREAIDNRSDTDTEDDCEGSNHSPDTKSLFRTEFQAFDNGNVPETGCRKN